MRIVSRSQAGLTAQVLLIFFALDVGFFLLGFPRVYRFAQSRMRVSKAVGSPARGRVVARTVEAVRTATRYYYRRRRDCLPRALTACLLLWRGGVPATLHIGVKRYPFGAHAWVECDGQTVIGDTRDDWRQEPYVPIIST